MYLSRSSLEFARQHITKFYASDFFPDADEYSAIWMRWDEVLNYYAKTDVSTLGTVPEDMSCAKAGGGYRTVHQLQPLDALTYTALVHHLAEPFEAKRVANDEGIACSYRIRLDLDEGAFFEHEHNGYGTFRSRSSDYCESFDWVFVADISSFYNHIYVHRVENAVELLGKSLKPVASDLHAFLLNLNEQVSIGIPVGPAASIIVAELILNEVDQFLRNHRLRPVYTRYVDDYRFFSDTKSDLQEIWHDLADFLYRSHRLTLSSGKCHILPAIDFQDHVLNALVDPARQELAETLGISFAEFIESYSDERVDDEIDESLVDLGLRKTALQELFSILLADPNLNIGLARRLLRRARKLNLRVIARPLVENLEQLGPVIRDAGLYLDRVLTNSALPKFDDTFKRFFGRHTEAVETSHMHYWLAWLLSGKTTANQIKGAENFISRSRPRFRARFARVREQPAWVRHNKAKWQQWGAWDRWALLSAAAVLAPGERRAWMDSVERSSDSFMDRLVASSVRSL